MTYRSILLAGLLLALSLPFPAVAQDAPDPRAIMQRVHDRDDGDNLTCTMEMILIDRDGGKRVRRLSQFGKDKGVDTLGLLFFLYPADVAGTGFLSWDYDDSARDDDQWLYLPALHKTKRIASSDKSGSFMGSDLSYADLTKANPNDYNYSLKKEMDVDGHKVWVIESVPKTEKTRDETGYLKSLLLVRQDNDVVVRSVSWLKNGDLKYVDMTKLELIDGIWVGTELHVTTKRNKEIRHQTLLRLSDVTFNQPLSEDFFSVRQLEKGL
ncbi:MAG: outer membrane lipoprotein-sorting protein [Desulfuromonas sp.]|nr:MAG: outer membrane lipoprotein-sorting protein [Desulfuromonas sp.]